MFEFVYLCLPIRYFIDYIIFLQVVLFVCLFSLQIGFLHMTLGLVLCVSNALHFRDWTTLCLSVLPQCVFFLCLIGFLCFLVILKWVTPSALYNKPSLIAVMIDFVMGGQGPKNKELILFDQQPFVEYVNPKP